jgi:hypothetical protein
MAGNKSHRCHQKGGEASLQIVLSGAHDITDVASPGLALLSLRDGYFAGDYIPQPLVGPVAVTLAQVVAGEGLRGAERKLAGAALPGGGFRTLQSLMRPALLRGGDLSVLLPALMNLHGARMSGSARLIERASSRSDEPARSKEYGGCPT